LNRENAIDKQIIAPGVGCQNDRDTTSLSILGGGFLLSCDKFIIINLTAQL
jgi:hypothetical protein